MCRVLLRIRQQIIMLSVFSGDCPYAESHYAEYRYAECRYAECHYAECSGTGEVTKNITLG
jgi:hypothetical protein